MVSFSAEQRFVVTGASSGIGEGVALLLNELGATVVGIGRSQARLDGMKAKAKCPDLVLAPAHHDKYEFYSMKLREMYYGYTDRVEPFGLDECWLDMTDACENYDEAVKTAVTKGSCISFIFVT